MFYPPPFTMTCSQREIQRFPAVAALSVLLLEGQCAQQDIHHKVFCAQPIWQPLKTSQVSIRVWELSRRVSAERATALGNEHRNVNNRTL